MYQINLKKKKTNKKYNRSTVNLKGSAGKTALLS